MKLDPETRERAAQDAHAAGYYPSPAANWDLLSEGSRSVWLSVADAVAATIPEPVEDERVRAWDAIASHPFFRSCYGTGSPLLATMLDYLDGRCQPCTAAEPEPHPQPIDPADVRVGDRVRWVVTREGVIHQDGCLVIDSGEHFELWEQGAALYLLDRPDPDAERAGRLRDALIAVTGQPLRYLGSISVDEIRAALKAAGLSIEPHPTGGDLHA